MNLSPSCGLVVALTLLVPTVAAGAWSTQGSEQKPHVWDARGNVRETLDWPGMGLAPRPHMDILSAWLEYHSNGTVSATIKMADLGNMFYVSNSWELHYTIEANLFRGGKPVCWLDVCYHVVLEASKSEYSREFVWKAWYAWPQEWSEGSQVAKIDPIGSLEIPVRGDIKIGAPGYVRFWFPLSSVAQHGDRLEGFHVESREYSLGWQVYNEAQSNAAFALHGWGNEKRPRAP